MAEQETVTGAVARQVPLEPVLPEDVPQCTQMDEDLPEPLRRHQLRKIVPWSAEMLHG